MYECPIFWYHLIVGINLVVTSVLLGLEVMSERLIRPKKTWVDNNIFLSASCVLKNN